MKRARPETHRGRLWLALLALFAIVFCATDASAAEKRKIVMVLDTSGSMAGNCNGTPNSCSAPANDPDRLAVLGAQIIVALTEGHEDATVFGFPREPNAPVPRLGANDLPSIQFEGPTPYIPALEASKKEFDTSPPDSRRVLIFFTDGEPTSTRGNSRLSVAELQPATQPLFAQGVHPVIIGLDPGGKGKSQIAPYLNALAGPEANTSFVEDPSTIVESLMRALARAFDSDNQSGVIDTTKSFRFDVGAGVDEVLIAVAGEGPNEDFTPQLDVPTGAPPGSGWKSGWNDTNRAVARHWATLRYAKPVEQALSLTLRLLPGARGKAKYGIIYKYDIVAEVDSTTGLVGKPVTITGRIKASGVARDKAWFDKSGFQTPTFTVAGEPITQVVAAPDGSFKGTWIAKRPAQGGSIAPVQVTFRNAQNIPLIGTGQITIKDATKLELHLPPQIDLGSWTGPSAWIGSPPPESRCQLIDLKDSPGAATIPITCRAEAWPGDVNRSPACEPDPASRYAGTGEPMRWRVCLDPKPCCGEMKNGPGGATRVVFSGKDPDYQAVSAPVVVTFDVARPSWLRCHWHWIAIAIAALLTIWILRGFLTPRSFEANAAFHVASTEAGLKKNQANVACEVPGGRRGFYRNARVAINASGDLVRDPKLAVLFVEAGIAGSTVIMKAAGLEKKDTRTSKWIAVPETDFRAGLLPKAVYRIGSLYVKWE
ncbi:MAG: vWA domain-containing protein [Labilithrix sp.]